MVSKCNDSNMSNPIRNIIENIENNMAITNKMRSVNLPTLQIRYSSFQLNLNRLNKELQKYGKTRQVQY